MKNVKISIDDKMVIEFQNDNYGKYITLELSEKSQEDFIQLLELLQTIQKWNQSAQENPVR
jgi:hypothetical protein